MRTRLLTRDELKELHRTELRRAFPPNELKPFSAMDALLNQGNYETWALVEGDTDVSWALLWYSPDRSCVLLDYLVTREDCRGRGLGSELLRLLKEQRLADLPILVESEAPEARDPEERRVQEHRLGFYARMGFVPAGFEVLLFRVHYRVLVLGEGPDLQQAYWDLYLSGTSPFFMKHFLRKWEESDK